MDLIKEQDQSEQAFLANYDASIYQKPSVSVDTLVFTIKETAGATYRSLPDNTLQILLIKRKNHPYKDHWALPGGFVEIDEDLSAAAKRELSEETGLAPSYFGQLYTYGEVERDPRTRVISTAYLAVVNQEGSHLKAGDDAKEAAWFDLFCQSEKVKSLKKNDSLEYQWYVRLTLRCDAEELSALLKITYIVKGSATTIEREIVESGNLAFDHAKIIEYGVEMLRHKIKYTDLVFKIVPEYFTLTQLQKVCETILNKTIPRASFRRTIADKVTETKRYLKKGGHRPSQLYKFDPNWLGRILEEGVVDLWS